MLKQGTFITGFFPKNIQQNLDEEVCVFAFPATEEGSAPPVVGGGDLATMLVDDDDNAPDVRTYYTETLDALGMTYDVLGDGKTVLKANYGTYWWNPGADFVTPGRAPPSSMAGRK